MRTFYPQEALEGFGTALASKLRVHIDYTTGQPRTDGRTVYLPAITSPLDRTEFAALCGVAIHEAAHVYFGTCDQMGWYVRNGGPTGEESLRQACFNAVVDVADETRIEGVIHSAKSLLYTSNREADSKIVKAGNMNTGDPVWAILAAGILYTRLGRCEVYRATRKHKHNRAMLAAYKILKGCKARRSKGGIPKQRRTNEQWRRLRLAAGELVDLLRPFGDGAAAPIAYGPAGTEADGMGAGNTNPGPGDQMADADAGWDLVSDPAPGSSGAGGATAKPHTLPPMDSALYTILRPSLAGPVERLARQDDADGYSSGFSSGPRVGRNIETALIDGRCFERRNAEGEKLHVAVVLDTSGSMESEIGRVAAIAQAFADAVRPVAASVSLATFSDGPTEVADFRDTASFNYGNTATDQALAWAERALMGKLGRRVCVVITDGQPNPGCLDTTRVACLSLAAAGVTVIGVAYLVPDASLRATMPRAQVIGAKSPLALSLQLGVVAQRIAG